MNACLSIKLLTNSCHHVPTNGKELLEHPGKIQFGPEKPFVKLRPAYCVKLDFSYVVKGWKIKMTMKFLALNHLRFEDTK